MIFCILCGDVADGLSIPHSCSRCSADAFLAVLELSRWISGWAEPSFALHALNRLSTRDRIRTCDLPAPKTGRSTAEPHEYVAPGAGIEPALSTV